MIIEASCDASPRPDKWMDKHETTFCVFHEKNETHLSNNQLRKSCWVSPLHNDSCFFIPVDQPKYQRRNIAAAGISKKPKLCVSGARRNHQLLANALQHARQDVHLMLFLRKQVHIVRRIYNGLPDSINITIVRESDFAKFHHLIAECDILLPLVDPNHNPYYFNYMKQLTGSISLAVAYSVPTVLTESLARIYGPFLSADYAVYQDPGSNATTNVRGFQSALEEMLSRVQTKSIVKMPRPREPFAFPYSRSPTDGGSQATAIPRRMVFVYTHGNILDTESPPQLHTNLVRTIESYNKAWNVEPGAQDVWFLTNDDCRAILSRNMFQLVTHYDSEPEGKFKSDMCRVAALFERGGYYFDNEMEVIEPVLLDDGSRFATVQSGHRSFAQSFIASEAGHPILRVALKILLDFYDERRDFIENATFQALPASATISLVNSLLRIDLQPRFKRRIESAIASNDRERAISMIKDVIILNHNRLRFFDGLIGPGTLKMAYDATIKELPNESVKLLQETKVDKVGNDKLFPTLRQDGVGKACNYVMHDESRAYFFSRMVGVNDYCSHIQR